LGEIVSAALSAGDAGTANSARQEYIRVLRESKQTTFIPETYADWADETFLMTGDIEKAGQIYRMAIQSVTEIDPKDLAKKVEYLEGFRRPAWFKK
jgi:hypothetical protein